MATPNKQQIEKLTKELISYMQKKDLFDMVRIYANGNRYSNEKSEGSEEYQTKYGSYFMTPNVDVRKIVEYNNPDTITMTFEGPLYHALNGYSVDAESIETSLSKLFEKYGLYYELGYAWSLACYEI